MFNKKYGTKGGVLLSFIIVFLICLITSLCGVFGICKNDHARAETEGGEAVAAVDDGAGDTAPTDPGNGTQSRPYILWGDTENKAHIWVKAIAYAQTNYEKIYVKLASDWVATANSKFVTSFAGELDYNLSTQEWANESTFMGGFFQGAVAIPRNVRVSLDLNGKTINRNLPENNGITNGYGNAVIALPYGQLDLNDSTAVGTGINQTSPGNGKITGAGGIGTYYAAGLLLRANSVVTINGGQICNNGVAGDLNVVGRVVGIYNYRGKLIMNGGSVHDNSSNGNGGGIFCDGATLEINGGKIYNNFASASGGGLSLNNSTCVIKNVIMYNNTAVYGGAIYVYSQTANSELIINNGEFYGNKIKEGQAGRGGVLYVNSDINKSVRSSVTINNGKFYNNTTSAVASFVGVVANSDVVINDCEVYGNKCIRTTSGTQHGSLMRCGMSGDPYLEINGGKYYDNDYEIKTSGATINGLVITDPGTGRFTMTGGEFYGNRAMASLFHLKYKTELRGGSIYGNAVASAVYPNQDRITNYETTVRVGDEAQVAAKLSGDFCVGYKKNADGSIVEAHNVGGGSPVKGAGAGGLYTGGLAHRDFFCNPNFTTITIDGEFTGKLNLNTGYVGVITKGWSTYNSDKNAKLSDYFANTTAPTWEISLLGGEIWFGVKGTQNIYAIAPTWENASDQPLYYLYDGKSLTVPASIDENGSSYVLKRTAGGSAVTLTAGKDYTVVKDDKTGLMHFTVNKTGKYEIVVSLKDGYKWSSATNGDESADKTLTFYLRKEVELPTQGNLNTGDTWVKYEEGKVRDYQYVIGAGADLKHYNHLTVNPDTADTELIAANDGSLTIDRVNQLVKVAQRGRYELYFALDNADEYVWADNTTAEKMMYFYCLTIVEAPQFDGGVQTVTVTPEQAAAGIPVTAYTHETLRPWRILNVTINGTVFSGSHSIVNGRVTIDCVTIDFNSGLITATKPGNYVIEVSRGVGYTEYLWNKNSNTGNQILTIYVKNTVDTPKWADGTTANKRYDTDSGSHSIGFVLPDGASVTCENENAEIAGNTLTVSKPGEYVLTFTLDDATGTVWADGDLSATKTLTVYIAKVVQDPVWIDGTNSATKLFRYTDSGVLLLKLSEGLTLRCYQSGWIFNNDTREVRVDFAGEYNFVFGLEEGYVWSNNSAVDKTMTARVLVSIPYPLWEDGSGSIKHIDYTGEEQSFNMYSPGARPYLVQIRVSSTNTSLYKNFYLDHGVTQWEGEYAGIKAKLRVEGEKVIFSATDPAYYQVIFLPEAPSVWADETTVANTRALQFDIRGNTAVYAPTWIDGTNNYYAEYAGSPYDFEFTEIPEGVEIARIDYGGGNGILNGNVLTINKFTTGRVVFRLSDTSIYKWADGSDSRAEKIISFYLRKKINVPVWGDGSSGILTFKKGGEHTITIIAPKVAQLTVNNQNAVMTVKALDDDYNEITIKASEVGNFKFTFANPNGSWYFWDDEGVKTSVANNSKALEFRITGAEEVDMPTWEDGTQGTKNFAFGESQGLTFTVNVPENATLLDEISNSAGQNGKILKTENGVATVQVSEAGIYTLKFVIDTENFVWANGSSGNVAELKAAVTNRVAVPTWTDNTTSDKYVTFVPGGVEVEFTLPENVAVSSSNADGVISGNKIKISEPGSYTLTFNFLNNKMCYAWDDGSFVAGASKTLKVTVTGGEKVELPSWSDGTTADKYVSMGAANKSVVTYKLPEGVTVSVASTSTPATVSISGGVATVTASAVGHYTVNFKIDTTKYVWADNSVSEVKTLKFHVTAKQIIDYPTWADGGIDIKYFDGSVVGASNVELGIKYDANKVVAELTDKDGNAIAGAVNGQTVSIPAGSGLYTVNFTLKDPANNAWENGSTGPRTLQAGIMNRYPVPVWEDSEDGTIYAPYNKDGNSAAFTLQSGLQFTLTYKDENGINRGAMTKSADGKTYVITVNGKEIKAVVEQVAGRSGVSNYTLTATYAGTYVLTFTVNDANAEDLWAWEGGNSNAAKTLTLTINGEQVEEVPLPAWADGTAEDKYFEYTGTSQTVEVNGEENYVISAVTAPASFSGNVITFNGVGKYTVTLKLANAKNYCWLGGEGGTKTLTFYVTGSTEVEIPQWSDGSVSDKAFTYDGTQKSVTINALGEGAEVLTVSAGVTQSGNTFSARGSATSTVTYTITFRLTDATTYKWSDNTVGNKTLVFRIIGGKTVVTIPEDVETLIYSGVNQTYALDFGALNGAVEIVSVSGGGTFLGKNISVLNAGSYVVTLRLKQTAETSYIWSNNSDADVKFTINVAQKEIETDGFKLNVFSGAYDGKAHPATVTGAPSWLTAKIEYVLNGKTVTEVKGAGEYTVKVTFTHENSNYAQTSFTLTGKIVIEKAVLSVRWTGEEVYNYDHGNPVELKAEVFGLISGETAPYAVYLDGANAAAAGTIGVHTAKVVLGDGTQNYKFAGDKTEITFVYEIKNLSETVTQLNVTFSQNGITLSNTDSIDKVKSGISEVTATYDNGYTETVTEYALTGDFGAANPYFAVEFGGKQSERISVTLSKVVDLDSIATDGVEMATVKTTVKQIKEQIEVIATYTDGATKKLSGSAFGLFENGAELADTATITEGKHVLTVSYTQGAVTATAEFTVTVEGVKLLSITAQLADGVKIYAGTTEAELKTALIVTAVYSDGSKAPAIGYILEYAAFTAGSRFEITVNYNGKTATVSGTVESEEITSLTAEWLGGGQTDSGMPNIFVYTDIEEIRDYIIVKANGVPVTGYLLSGGLVAGDECEITVTYANRTAVIKVTVSETPSTVTFKETRATFAQGAAVIFPDTPIDSLKNLLTVSEVYEENGKEIIKEIKDYTLSGSLTAGVATVTARWTVEGSARTATFKVNVTAVALETLTVEWKAGSQPEIFNDAKLDDLKSLLKVSGINNDGSSYGTITANDYALSGTLSAGSNVITLTLAGAGKSVEFTVEVSALKIDGLTVDFDLGANKVFSTTDLDELKKFLTVTVNYNHGEPRVLLADEYTLSGVLTANSECEITVTYNGVSQTFNVRVEEKEISRIEVNYKQSGTLYSSNSLTDIAGKGALTVTVFYNDGTSEAVTSGYTLSGQLTTGKCLITVDYGGVSDTFEVNVTAVTLIGVSANLDGKAPQFYTTTSKEVIKSYITVTAYYSNGTTKTLLAGDYELTGELTAGDCDLTVEYDSKSCTVTVPLTGVKLESIAVEHSALPAIFENTDIETLKQYLKVTAYYTDGKMAEVSGYELSATLKAGKTCSVTVSYGGQSATFSVAVEQRLPVSVSATYNGGEVTASASLDDIAKDIVLTVTYAGGATDTVTSGFTLSGDLKAPSATLTVTYGGKTCTVSVPVSVSVTLTGITAELAPGAQIYASADVQSLKNLITVIAHYSDGTEKAITADGYVLSGTLNPAGGVSTLDISLKSDSSVKTEITVTAIKVEFESITAVFDAASAGKILISDKLSSLEAFLKVTGVNNDGSLYNGGANITGYNLFGELVAGECVITVEYLGKKTTFKINVYEEDEEGTPVTLTKAEAAWTSGSQPEEAKLFATEDETKLLGYAEELKKYLTVTATYSNGVSKEVSNYETVSASVNSEGKLEIVYAYPDKTSSATFTVTADMTEIALESISADFDQSGKTVYASASLSSLESMLTVTGINNDGSLYNGGNAITSGYVLSGELSAGRCVITVTYRGKTATFTVEVTAVKVVALNVTVTGTLPEIYSTTDIRTLKNYIEVVAEYNDGSPAKVVAPADYEISGTLLAGRECALTVTYNGVEQTFSVTVKAGVLKSLKAEYDNDGNAPAVYSSTDLDSLKQHLKVTAEFTGGTQDKLLSASEYTLSGNLTAGACTVKVSYNGKTTSFIVNVTEVALVSINAEFDQANAPEIFATADLDDLRRYVTVTANYSDGKSKVITGYDFDSGVKLAEGENIITVLYGEQAATFKITVTGVRLGGISAEFDLANAPAIFATTDIASLKNWLKVFAAYTDGKAARVYDYTLTGTLSAGKTCTLTVSYGGKSATFDVTVEKKSVVSIAVSGVPSSIPVTQTHEELANAITVTVSYSDGTSERIVKGFTLTGSITPGTHTFTVSYGGKSAQFNVTVENSYTLDKITAVFEQGNTRVYQGASVDPLKNMLTVTAHYVDALGYSAGARVLDGGEYSITGNLGAAGNVTLTASFSQMHAQFTVAVTGIELDSITAAFNAGNVSVTASTPLDTLKQYLKVTGLNNDGTLYNNGNAIPANEYMIYGDLVAGQICTLTVRCNNVSTTFSVAVAADVTLSGVTATFDQSKIGAVYSSSDKSMLAGGLVVTASYSDGSSRVIAYPNYSIICDISGGTNPVIKIDYAPWGSQITATGALTVTPVEVDKISAAFNQNGKPITTSTTLAEFEQMLKDGSILLTVVGINNDGSFAGVINGYTLSCNFASSGEVTVTYNGKTATFNVIVLNRELSMISVSYSAGDIFESGDFETEIKKQLVVEAVYTSGDPETVDAKDYTLTYTEVSRDSERVGYSVTVHYFGKDKVIPQTVYVTLLKLTGVSAAVDPAYGASVVIYDSMSAQEAAELVKDYLTITGTYNDGDSKELNLSEFVVSGDLSVADSDGKSKLTLVYTANNALSCTFKVEVTKVALAEIEVTYFLQHTTAVFASNTLADLENLISSNRILLDITAKFNNGSSRVLGFSDYALSADASEFNSDGETFKQGERTIKVTYTHGAITKTTQFKIKVDPVNVGTLTATVNNKTIYTVTTLKEFTDDILTVTAFFNDGTPYNPTKDEYVLNISDEKPFITFGGQKASVEVTYGGKTVTIEFNVKKAEVEIDVSGMGTYEFNPSLTMQIVDDGAKLTLNGVEVTDAAASLVYSNNTFASLADLTLTDGKYVIKVRIDFAGDNVYAAATKEVTVEVSKAKVDMSGYGFVLDGGAFTDGAEVTYDPSKTYTLELDASNKPSAITGVSYSVELEYNGSTNTVSSIHDSGVYKVMATFTVSSDYEQPQPVSVTFTIKKAQAELDLSGVTTRFTYTGLPQTVDGATVKTGSQQASDISYMVDGTPCAGGFAFTNVADGNGKTVVISIPEQRNYLGDTRNVSIIVSKAQLEITANDKTIDYGDKPANDGVTVVGLVNGETLDALGVTFEYSYNYEGTDGKLGDVGKYHIRLSIKTGSLDNYEADLVDGTLTVVEKEVKIIWTLTDVTYDGKPHKPLASYVNVNGVIVIPTVTLADGSAQLTGGEAINAGKYIATAVKSDKNYVFDALTATLDFEIKKAAFSVTKAGDSWYADGLDYDIDKLVTLDSQESGKYSFINFVGENADIEIRYSTNAYVKGTSVPSSKDDGTVISTSKPLNVISSGSYIINYRVIDKNGNHETYYGQWSLDILNDTDPDAKFMQVIFNKPYAFTYGSVPESEAELEALAAKLWDEEYIDTSLIKLSRDVFLDNVKLVLKTDNDNLADKNTPFGLYTIHFEWKDGSAYSDWLITYKKNNAASDSNVGKLQIDKKQLFAVWSQTSFIANGNVHLPKLTVSGFDDGSVYELELTSADGGNFVIEKDGRILNLTVAVNGNLASAGAHVITLSLDNANYDLDGAVTAISVTAPTVITVSWDNVSFTYNGNAHLPNATVSDGADTAVFSLTAAMLANGGAEIEVTLGGVIVKLKITITGSGNVLTDAGKYTITVTVDDERYTLPSGSTVMTVEAPVVQQEGLSPLMIGIISAVAVLAVLIVIVIIVVIRRKPAVAGSNDGFDDYVE